MINPNTLAIDRKGGKREKGGGDGIDDSGGCSKVSRKGKWSRIGRFRSISRVLLASRPSLLPPRVSRPVSGVPLCTRGQWGPSRQNRYRPFFVPPPPPLPPLFRRMFEKQRGGRADGEKTIKEGRRFNII